MQNHVLLVNESDEPQGTMEKIEAHRKGLLHRAFSVFVFNTDGNLLLQQRAAGKYHGAGLWTNTCCSHPYPDEDVVNAAQRRLNEEMGFKTNLKKAFHFTYKAAVENNLTEHEFDHVFVGTYDGIINPNTAEVAAYRFVNPAALQAEVAATPHNFTTWFRIALPQVLAWQQSALVTCKTLSPSTI